MRAPKRRTWLILGALVAICAGGWFAWDRGMFDPDDQELVRSALEQSGDDDFAGVQGVIAVYDEQTERYRSGRRRHGPWRYGRDAYVDALGRLMQRVEPGSEAARVAAQWLIGNDRSELGREALVLMHGHHMASVQLDSVTRQPHEEARNLLADQTRNLPDASARARAQLALAEWHLATAEAARYAPHYQELSDPEARAEYAFWRGGAERLEFALGRDPEAEHAAAVELLAELRPRVEDLFAPDQIEEIEALMVRQLDLGVGTVAPEIVGTDLDGREMRLSDFRGKIVLLDFWGDW